MRRGTKSHARTDDMRDPSITGLPTNPAMMPSLRAALPAWLVPGIVVPILCLPATLASQVVLSDCTGSCGLSFERTAALGEDDGPGYVGRPVEVVRRSDGVYALIDRADQDRVKFFDAEGGLIRSFGRRGQGPGEFHTVNHLSLIDGDSVVVYDLGSRRFTVIGPDFTVVRVFGPVDLMSNHLVRLPEGDWIMNARAYSPPGIGLPLHRVDGQGRVLLSFGADPPIADIAQGNRFRRRLAARASEPIWSVDPPRYLIEGWSRNGQPVQSLERSAEWFTAHDGAVLDDDGRPLPYVRAFHQDRDGLLWTIVWVPAPRWEQGLRQGEGVHGQPATVMSDVTLTPLYDSVVEAIDPETGRVLRSQRFEVPFWGFVEDGSLFALEESDSDFPELRISVWSIETASGLPIR